ncbi:glycosyltransferase family 9 protein [Caulobacter sp. SL161]|uniref:glycosyltransferase family 9 protein n=1 Tax=Caulobacter sp. SL161 TaxID=2995156 RepID=UPI002276DB58|nr:glycosyltransferase family 9 protein [Caulobacter sp. SL161]MCY1645615.1 glycosyltransferase family 9 protein [Caulobacter sp. SL161]
MSASTFQGPVLVYAPDRGIGDLMWHLPTIRAIAATLPEGKVVLVARPSSRASEVLKVEPSVARVLYAPHYKDRLKGVRETLDFHRICRAERPRAVWILEKIDRPAIAAALAGVPERRGFGLGHSQERFLTTGPFLPKAIRPAHRIEKLEAFEKAHGLVVTSREPSLTLDLDALEAVQKRYADRPGPWLCLGIGASEPARTWPADRFAETARRVSDLFGTVFWVGGPHEAERAKAATGDLTTAVVACDLPLDQSAALISLSAGFLGNDSGALNVAAAVGTPCVGLMGTAPVPAYSRWLSRLDGGQGRIADITVEEAVAAVRSRFVDERWGDARA